MLILARKVSHISASSIRKTEDGWYAAKCAQVPEAITQGRTLEEVKENLVDAIELVLLVKKERTIIYS